MATVQVQIVYTGPVVDEIRKGMEIARYFSPDNSYVDSPVFTDGYANPDAVGDGNTYGKSIYATNVEGWGELAGILPMASFTGKFAQFERAVLAAKAALDAGEENEGITFEIEGYEEEIYWNQMAANMVEAGFYSKVGDKEYGPSPFDNRIVLKVVAITDNSVDLFGKVASDLQSGIQVSEDAITGNLKYVADYTGFSSKVEEQSGNYLALHAEVEGADATISVKVTKAVTLQEDGDVVLRIADHTTQTVTVTAKIEGQDDIVQVYSLAGLNCASA